MDDVRDHRLVPEHTVVEEETIEGVLDEYDIRRTDLPKISRLDPALRKTEAATGDVVKVTRDSRTAEAATVYRLVIEP